MFLKIIFFKSKLLFLCFGFFFLFISNEIIDIYFYLRDLVLFKRENYDFELIVLL